MKFPGQLGQNGSTRLILTLRTKVANLGKNRGHGLSLTLGKKLTEDQRNANATVDYDRFGHEMQLALLSEVSAGRSVEDIERALNRFFEFNRALKKPDNQEIKRMIAQAVDQNHRLQIISSDEVVGRNTISRPAAPLIVETPTEASHRVAQQEPAFPPRLGEFILECLLSKPDKDNIIGDLTEEYQAIITRFGSRKAKFWYWAQVIRSLYPLVRGVLKLSVVTWIARILGKFLSRIMQHID